MRTSFNGATTREFSVLWLVCILCLLPCSVTAMPMCTACTAHSNCNMLCVGADGQTDSCAAYACSNDPCSSKAATALEARRAQTPAWNCAATLTSLTINGVAGYARSCTQGRIVWSAGTCAQRMPVGSIYNRYFTDAASAATRSAVGFPMGPPDNGAANGTQRFQIGYLATNAAGVAVIVGGITVPNAERVALISKWKQPVWEKPPPTIRCGPAAARTSTPSHTSGTTRRSP